MEPFFDWLSEQSRKERYRATTYRIEVAVTIMKILIIIGGLVYLAHVLFT